MSQPPPPQKKKKMYIFISEGRLTEKLALILFLKLLPLHISSGDETVE